VFLDRSPEFVVAACGILWAGAAYLPVDTTSPQDRVGFVLADADVATVVTSAHHHPRLPEGRWRPLVVDGPGPEG
jgi:non-ribosomal peptide synthetase component F